MILPAFFFIVNSKYHGTVENYEIVFYFCTVQTVRAFCYPSQGTSLFDVLANEAMDGRHRQKWYSAHTNSVALREMAQRNVEWYSVDTNGVALGRIALWNIRTLYLNIKLLSIT